MSLQTSTPNNIRTLHGNGLSVFLQADGQLYLKDSNGKTALLSDYVSGGGGGANIYNSNGSLTANRLVFLNEHTLSFLDGADNQLFYIDPTLDAQNLLISLQGTGTDKYSEINISSDTDISSITQKTSFETNFYSEAEFNSNELFSEINLTTTYDFGTNNVSLNLRSEFSEDDGDLSYIQAVVGENLLSVSPFGIYGVSYSTAFISVDTLSEIQINDATSTWGMVLNATGALGLRLTLPTNPNVPAEGQRAALMVDLNGTASWGQVGLAGTIVGELSTLLPQEGDRAYVTDALATTFYSVAIGGGTNITPVFYDGANWRIG